MNSSATLRKMLLAAFSDVSCLNAMHTLAACDYYDSYKVFPEDGVNLNSNGFESNLEYWGFQAEKEINSERNSKTITIKSYHWSSVEPEYMERHWAGIYYIEPYAFKFYLAAWIHLYIEFEEKMGVVSSCFLKLLEGFLGDNPVHEVDFSVDQKLVIASFMLLVVQRKNSESDTAKQCLDVGWWYNLDSKNQDVYLSI